MLLRAICFLQFCLRRCVCIKQKHEKCSIISWHVAVVLYNFYSCLRKYESTFGFKSKTEHCQCKRRLGLRWAPTTWVNDREGCSMAEWSVFISLFIDSLALLRVFEINNSQQKSDRGMKISTFPAVKPFIKLTRGRIKPRRRGVEKWRLERERKEGGKQVQHQEEGGKEGKGYEKWHWEENRSRGKVKEAKFS